MATLELTVISASIPPHLQLDLEPKDTYAIIRCAQEQRRTKTTHDHGRTPVWNETFAFNLGDQDVPKFLFVQIFATRSDTDELLGVARIPIFTTGETEGSLHVLVSPDKGETGKLKAAWRWKSIPQQSSSLAASSVHDVTKDEREYSPVLYPPATSTYDEVTSAMAKLAVHKGQDKEPYPPTAYGSTAYSPNCEPEERSTFTSEPYPPPNDLSKTSYPPSSPYPPTTDAYPLYPNYLKPLSSSEESYLPSEKGEKSSSSTTRGLGDTKDEGHHSHMPYGYAPPGTSGGGYPPPPGYPSYGPPSSSPYPPTTDAYPPYPNYPKPLSSSEESYLPSEKGEKSSSSTTRGLGDTKDKGHHSHMPYGYAPPGTYGGGYPPPPGYPSYGPPSGAYAQPPGYPPAPAYPPAPHSAPPAPYGYPPSVNPYPQQPYPPYGYPPQAPYPVHHGHGSYAPGMYVGHSSHGKHSKHYKHHKMPKHSMSHYGHAMPHYGHYKHKKHKGFGKGYKFKKFKGFKKFKF